MNAIGMQLRDLINSGLTQRRLTALMHVVAESRRDEWSPCLNTRLSLSVDNERASVGRDGRNRLARFESQAGVDGDKSRIGNLTRLIYTLLKTVV